MRLANGGLELEGLALPIKGGSLHIETLLLGLLRVHVRGVRLKTALPNATKSNGLAKLVRRLAARLVAVSVEGPIEVTITAKEGEITAKAINCHDRAPHPARPAVSVSRAPRLLRELTVSADGARASEVDGDGASAAGVERAKALSSPQSPAAGTTIALGLARARGCSISVAASDGCCAGGALGAFSIYGGKPASKKAV